MEEERARLRLTATQGACDRNQSPLGCTSSLATAASSLAASASTIAAPAAAPALAMALASALLSALRTRSDAICSMDAAFS